MSLVRYIANQQDNEGPHMAKSTKNAKSLHKLENAVDRIINSVVDDDLAAGATVKSRKKPSKKRAKKPTGPRV